MTKKMLDKKRRFILKTKNKRHSNKKYVFFKKLKKEDIPIIDEYHTYDLKFDKKMCEFSQKTKEFNNK